MFAMCANLCRPPFLPYQKTQAHYSCVATFALAANSFAPKLQSASLCVFHNEWSGTGLSRRVTQLTPSKSEIGVCLFVFIVTASHGNRQYALAAANLWNQLLDSVRTVKTLTQYKTLLKHLFRVAFLCTDVNNFICIYYYFFINIHLLFYYILFMVGLYFRIFIIGIVFSIINIFIFNIINILLSYDCMCVQCLRAIFIERVLYKYIYYYFYPEYAQVHSCHCHIHVVIFRFMMVI